MSKKNKNGGFNNRAARRFNDPSKIDRMSEKEIYDILMEDIETILAQITAHRNHDRGAKYPTYVNNIFANLSSAKFFYEFALDNTENKKKNKVKTTLNAEQVLSMKQLLADAYRYSSSNKDAFRGQMQEYKDRLEYISLAFIRYDPVVYEMTKKLKLEKKEGRRELCIQIYQDPIYAAKSVGRLYNASELTDKKKLKLVRAMYDINPLDHIKVDGDSDVKSEYSGKKRFQTLVGATFCVPKNNSDFFDMLFTYVDKLPKRKRAKYIRAYAEAFKIEKSHNKRLEGEFYDKNKPIIKELIGTKKKKYLNGIDVGYKKAFKCLKVEETDGEKKVKSSDRQLRNDHKNPWDY